MTVLRELWYCHVAVLSFHASSLLESSSISVRVPFFIRFSGAVLEVFRNSKWVMRHIVGKLSTSSFQRYKVCANRSSDEGVMAPGSRGVGAVFVHFSGCRFRSNGGMLSANREFHVVAGVIIFPTHPGSRINLLRAGKTLRAKAALPMSDFDVLGTVGKLALPIFARFRICGKSELGLVRYGPANRGHRGVFGPFEGSFPIGIPAGPDKFLAIREFHVVHGMCPSFQCARARRSTCCESGRLCAQAWQRRPCTEASLGSQDMILANGGRRNVPYAKGGGQFDPVFGLVNGPVKPWSNLVNLGQTWSNLVKALQTLGDVSRTYISRVSGHGGSLVGLETARSNLGQTSVNPSQTWSTLVKLGQTSGNVSRTFFLGVFDAAKPSSDQIVLVRFGLSRFAHRHPRKSRTLIDDQSSPTRPIGPNRLRGDLTWGLPKLQIGWFNGLESQSKQMSDRGSGSGGHRRSDRLAKGKAVAYAPESSPDTDDEYDAMEDVRTRFDASIARNLQAELDAEAAGPSSYLVSLLVPAMLLLPHLVVPHTRSTGIPPSRLKRQRTEGIPDSAGTIPEDYVAPGFRYPPHGGIRPRYPVAVEISDTPLLTNLLAHPSSLVRRCQEPPYSAGRGGWSEFSRLLAVSRPEYREFLIELGFGPFLSIPYVSVYHPAVWCFIERFFHHTGTFHLSTCEMARATRRPSVRIRHLADVLRRDREEPPTELRYRQWAAYLIFSCFLGNDRSIVPTPIVGMFRDIDTLREYDWGALTYGFYIRGLRRYSRRESISFLGFWQFTVFWAFEHFPTFRSQSTSLRMTVDCIRDADIIFQPYSAALSQRPEVFRAVALSRLRLWIRTTRSWELLLGERTVRQLGDEAVVPVDPSPLMTIEDYIPRAPSDPYIAGVSAYPSLVREGVPYQEWFEQVSLGSLMSLHEVEGGRVMGGVAMDSHHIRSSGQIERLESEILRLQLELSVSVDRHTADMDRVQGEMAKVARLAAAVRRLEEQLQGMGITPVTGADPSGLGQPSSSPPRDPVSRDWFFDDPPSS
uniref:Aminotransferase-like plant mobile domain-containing protein n=1 Tax=Fagus sylvatica TaxID=28930 RepID=A0A2N9IQ65_FAGSY